MKSRVVFIAGSARSGTTWMRRCLASHPDVAALRETQVMHHATSPQPGNIEVVRRGTFWRKLRAARRAHASFPDVFQWSMATDGPLSIPTPAPVVRELLQLQEEFWRYESWVDVAREMFRCLDGLRPVIVEKTPAHVYQVDTILQRFPESRFLLPIRDGRDILGSARDFFGDRYPSITTVQSAANRWNLVCAAMGRAKARWPDRVMLIRYEDLLDHFEEMLARMLRFVGLQFDAAQLHHIAEQNTFAAYRGGHGTAAGRGGKFFRRGTSGGYQEELSGAEIEAYEAIAGPNLEALGYPLATRCELR